LTQLKSLLFFACLLVNGANAQSTVFASREAQLPSERIFASPADTEEQRHIAEKFVQERLSIWQERLKLMEWQISVVVARRSDLKPKTLGATHWDKEKKCATISVLDPRDYKLPFEEVLNDLELTVVHELVHLNLSALPRSESSRKGEELAVVKIANALIAVERRQDSRN